MDEKFFVDYEALVYNMPACKGFEFLDHVFVVNNVTTEIEKIIKPDKEPLTMNFAFLNCVVNDEKGNNVFITVKNKITLEVLSDAESDEKLHKQIVDIVRRKMEAVEQHLIFITNLHIFFPTVQISVCSENETKKQSYGYTNNRPMLFRKWTGIAEGIDIGRRLEMNINKDVFDTFRQDKKHKRYNRAFEYYIRSFYEFNHSSAFCMLCASIDAITGNNVVGLTKKDLQNIQVYYFVHLWKQTS